MKNAKMRCAAGTFLLLSSLASRAQTEPADDVKMPYPAEVALSDEGDKGFVFRRFPGSQRLYTYDRDSKDRSACNLGCYEARPPVLAPASATPVGNWTVFTREDGAHQWAYKGHPVYTLFHDAPGDPKGDGEDGMWHLLAYIPRS